MSVTFVERQRLRTWWLWALILAVAALAWVGWVVQIVLGRPFGDDPGPDWMIWLLLAVVGVGLPLLLGTFRLDTEVRDGVLRWRLFPFVSKSVRLDDIVSAEARTYRPIREYWGWGIRFWPGRGWAYTIDGTRGVQLHLRSGPRILLGSRRPEELAAAIAGHRG